MRSTILAILMISLSGCCIFQGPPDPEKIYIYEKEYILPDLPDELLRPVEVPESRVWTTDNLQGEVGGYILELNTNIKEANNKINSISDYIDALREDINNVHNPDKD